MKACFALLPCSGRYAGRMYARSLARTSTFNAGAPRGKATSLLGTGTLALHSGHDGLRPSACTQQVPQYRERHWQNADMAGLRGWSKQMGQGSLQQYPPAACGVQIRRSSSGPSVARCSPCSHCGSSTAGAALARTSANVAPGTSSAGVAPPRTSANVAGTVRGCAELERRERGRPCGRLDAMS